MKQKIFDAIGVFKYDTEVLKRFFRILDIRFGKSEVLSQFEEFLTDSKKAIELLENADNLFLIELKRLNLINLEARLEYIRKKNIPETVVISYMKVLVKEIEQQSLFAPVPALEQAEDQMFAYLLDGAVYNDDLTELEGISNTNLRLILQTWILYPDLVKHPEKCIEMLECFSISAISF